MRQPAPTRRQKLDDREAAILAAARAVFVEQGYESGRVAEIARRAGVAEGTVYLHYRTKAELMQAVVEQWWSALTENARAAIDPQAACFIQLAQFAEFHLSAFLDQIEYINLNAALRAAHQKFDVPLDPVRAYARLFDTVI